MIEFCFDNFEYYIQQIKNADNQLVFTLPRRLVRELPDIDFITKNVSEKNPYCLITMPEYKETKFGIHFDTYPDYRITDIAHTGTGTATFETTGKHQGNNSYILKIATSGAIGTEPYPTYQLKINDEDYTDPEPIPADGKISIEDNLTFDFEIGGEVIEDDTYSFQTIALQVKVYKEKSIELTLRADIWAKKKNELFAAGGYFEQLSNLLIDRYVTDGIQVISVSPSPAHWLQSEFEKENQIVRGALQITYQGAIYTKKYDSLITKFLFT